MSFAINTPKGLANLESDRAERPSAYRVNRFEMTNSRGQSRDIRQLVKEFTIHEDIFSPIVTLQALIRDDVNFLETFGISGHETISISLGRTNSEFGSSSTVDLELCVLEYPSFTREDNAYHVQYYSLVAVSDFAYVSRLKKLSRAVSGPSLDVSRSILTGDLNIPESVISVRGEAISTFNSVIPTCQPLAAVATVLKKTYASDGSPFLIFPRISTGNINIWSYSSVVADESYSTYTYDYTLPSTPRSGAGFSESSSRILAIRSNLNMNRLDQANSGAFASRTNFLDISTKTYYTHELSGSGGENAASYAVNRSSENVMPIGRIASAHINEVPVNSRSYEGGLKNPISGGHTMSVYSAQSLLARSEGNSHEIDLYGNFELNPGRNITLELPKAVDHLKRSQIFGTNSDRLDTSLSGKYMIASSLHSFRDGEYKVTLKVIRDTSSK